MPLLILLLFIGLPIAEIAVLIKVADVINLWPTIALIILTAVIGVSLLRMQGLSALSRAQTSLNEGRLPVDSITDAVALMLAGAFLLTPGLITDTLGFALLIPAVRHGLARHLFNKARNSAHVKVDMFGMGGAQQQPHNPFEQPCEADPRRSDPPKQGPVIEGEVIEPEKPDPDKAPPSPPPKDKRSPWNK